MSTFFGFVSAEGKFSLDFPTQFRAFLKRFKGCEVELEIREKRTKRSLRQNAAFHALLTPWAREEGHSIDDLKRDVLREVFGTHERTNPITGEVTEALNQPHSSKLSVGQFCELIERTLEIAASCGHVLSAPDEYRKAKEQAQKQKARAA